MYVYVYVYVYVCVAVWSWSCVCVRCSALQCGHDHVYVRVAVRCSVVMIMCTSARYACLLDDDKEDCRMILLDDAEGYTHDHVRIQCGSSVLP